MKYIKLFETFESPMKVLPEVDYSKFNLECDGIDPMGEWQNIDGVINKKRRVSWDKCINVNNLPNYLNVIKIYDLENPDSYSGKIGLSKIKELYEGGWGKLSARNFVNKELIIYNRKYKKQAELAHKELLRRGGWWHQTEPIADIYLARLMGYGEEYIVPYIRKFFPNFNIDIYIKENPRKEVLDIN